MDFLRRIPLARSPALSESGRTEAPFGHTANRNLKPNANNHGRWHGVVALAKSPIRTPNESKHGQSYPERPRMPAYRLTYILKKNMPTKRFWWEQSERHNRNETDNNHRPRPDPTCLPRPELARHFPTTNKKRRPLLRRLLAGSGWVRCGGTSICPSHPPTVHDT